MTTMPPKNILCSVRLFQCLLLAGVTLLNGWPVAAFASDASLWMSTKGGSPIQEFSATYYYDAPSRESSLLTQLTDPSTYERENFGYSEPILDPSHIGTPATFSLDPGVIGGNVLLAIFFFLVVGTSNYVFNNIIESHGDAMHGFMERLPFVRACHRWYSSWESRGRLHRWPVLLLLLATYAAIGAHVNASFSLLPSQNIGMALVTLVTLLISAYLNDLCKFVVALRWKLQSIAKPHLSGVVLAIACVIISRTMQVSPGYLYGIPVSLFILSALKQRDAGLLEFLGIVWMIAVALTTWGATPLLTDYQILHDFGNLLYVVLIEGIFFYLLPLGYLPGAAIFAWHKWVWGLLFSSNVFFLFHTLFNPNSTLGNLLKNTPARNTLLLLGIFAAGSLILWAILQLKKAFTSN